MTNIIITMAGVGKRFRDAGYDCPKYCIEAHGRTLFAWSMLSLRSFIRAGAKFTFVVRRDDHAAEFIQKECRELGIDDPCVVELGGLTDGQATSAVFGGEALDDPTVPLLIYNIDTFVHPDALPAEAVRGDGWIPCFEGEGDGWSFAAADPDGRVTDIREKNRISSNATIGLYWFSSFELYRRIYTEFYTDSSRIEKNEKYIAPMYRQMIEEGLSVFIRNVDFDSVVPLGTPAEVDAFLLSDAPSL